jgi:hypothetical protein
METPPIVQYQYRRSFLATAAMGASVCLATFTLCAAVIILYGMHVLDTKTQGLAELAASAVRGLPEFAKSLPPLLSDTLRDERRPDYRKELEIKARLAPARDGRGMLRPVLEVRNTGTSVVSLLGLRVTILDADGVPIGDWTPWGATPFATDDGLPGLLMPGETRRLAGHCPVAYGDGALEQLRIETEITELRLWEPARAALTAPEKSA